MKKNLLIFILFIFIGFIPFNITMAESTGTYTTQSGVILPKELYDELCKIYSKNYIEELDSGQYMELYKGIRLSKNLMNSCKNMVN